MEDQRPVRSDATRVPGFWRVLRRGPLLLGDLFFFQAEDGIRDYKVTGVQTCALPIFTAGVIVGNAFHPELPNWLSFLGSFAGIVLTFLAGAEVDVPQFRREWRASLSIGRSEERRVGEECRSRWSPYH